MKAAEKYAEAVRLYAETELSVTDIARQCSLSRAAFAAFIQRYHRDLLFRRHGNQNPDPDTSIVNERLRGETGQTRLARNKYHDAIEACDNIEFINLTVAEIARKFGVSPAGLSNQLRVHYPEITERRDKERQRLGIAAPRKNGASKKTTAQYAEAVNLLASTTLTIQEAAEKCGVSFTGLRQHLQFYHRDMMRRRLRGAK